jgi:hypothetical protein
MWHSRPSSIATSAFLLLALASHAPGEIALQGAVVVDGTGREPRRVTVVVRGERIAAILPAGSPVPSGATVVDLAGRTLIPGLSDAYWPVSGASVHAALAELLGAGVTSVRAIGPVSQVTALRHAVEAGALPGPRLTPAGEPIRLGAGAGADELRGEVRARARQGAAWALLDPSTPPDLLRAAVAEAGDALDVAGPLWRTPWTAAARGGIDVLLGPAPWSEYYLPARERERFRAALSREGRARAQIEWLGSVDVGNPELDRLIRWLRRRRITVVPQLAALAETFHGKLRDARSGRSCCGWCGVSTTGACASPPGRAPAARRQAVSTPSCESWRPPASPPRRWSR